MERMGHEVKRNSNTRKTWGVLLVIIGGLLIANAVDILPYKLTDILISWEMVLIVVGVFSLVNNQSKVIGIVLISLGVFFLFENYWEFPYYVRKAFWPTVVVVFGLYLIISPPKYFKNRKERDKEDSRDFIDEVSIFGGSEKMVTSNSFKGGSVTSIFGGSKINLMNSDLAVGENILDTFGMFGGTTIIIPAGWNVKVEVAAIFGGFSDKRQRMPNLVFDQEKLLVIKGLAIFGGGEVKSFGM
jgi:predicted membrane protein